MPNTTTQTTAAPSLDPRVAGGLYFCGYWQQSYEVLAMWSGIQRGDTGWMRVRWADGTTTQHATPWDSKRDHVIGQGA